MEEPSVGSKDCAHAGVQGHTGQVDDGHRLIFWARGRFDSATSSGRDFPMLRMPASRRIYACSNGGGWCTARYTRSCRRRWNTCLRKWMGVFAYPEENNAWAERYAEE